VPFPENDLEIDIEPMECNHKSKLVQLLPVLQLDGNYVCSWYHLCQVNQLLAVRERHVMEQIQEPDLDIFMLCEAAYRFNMTYKRVGRPKPWSADRIIKITPSTKKARAAKAFEDLKRDGWRAKDFTATAIPKFEKYDGRSVYGPSDILDEMKDKPCRLIQYLSHKRNYEFSRFVKPVEDRLFRMGDDGRICPVEDRVFMKGLTSFEIARALRKSWDSFEDPVAILWDYSRMDSHKSNFERAMHGDMFYKRHMDREAVEIFRRNLDYKVHCYSKDGYSYKQNLRMLSGVRETSLEDCITNISLGNYWFWRHRVKNRLHVNGDDGVAIIARTDLNGMMADIDYWRKVGFKMKFEVAYDFRHIDFCQCRPVKLARGWRMVRNPCRVMSRSSYTTKTLSGTGWRKLIGAIGMGELACNTGVPVLQSYAQLLIRTSRGLESQAFFDEYMMRRKETMTFKPEEVTYRARLDFHEAFGISVTEQIEIESCFEEIDELPVVCE